VERPTDLTFEYRRSKSGIGCCQEATGRAPQQLPVSSGRYVTVDPVDNRYSLNEFVHEVASGQRLTAFVEGRLR
jgi:hypothetical protein